ncbi:MAG: A/G-specific adenine glycosylase [Bacteroidota bacterium]
MLEKQLKEWFLRSLKQWHLHQNKREMPWKGERDPYKIWLSEIILQQTRVEQGWAYYERFIEQYPTVHHLAQSVDNEVFKLWEGLGYYNRCRNLLTTARKISSELNGQFPMTKEGLLALKGVGGYTAAAIGSFAFGLPLAVLDGNVYRILSRVFGIQEPIDQSKGKFLFEQLANELLDTKHPAAHNQAMMDFGATVCTPKNPNCNCCPFADQCVAFQKKMQHLLPTKAKKIKSKQRFLYYLLLECNQQRLVRKRGEGDIWKDLYEFYLVEKDEPADELELKRNEFWSTQKIITPKQINFLSDQLIHQLTHQKIHSRILSVSLTKKINIEGYEWVDRAAFKQLALPRLITRFLETY